MSTEPLAATLDISVVRRQAADSSLLSDYLALTKPEVNFLIAITTFAGFYLGCAATSRDVGFVPLINAVLGTMLVASGAGTLNQYVERRFDAQMRRTSRRPLAAGRLNALWALGFGVTLSVAGSIYLVLAVNPLAGVLALLTLVSYLFLYTPLKRRTPLCTLVGAVPGAMPPLIGWASAAGGLNAEAWLLFGAVFLWQFPHFMAIAWMYRDDYARAGYLVLPQDRTRGRFAILQTLLPLLLLLPLSVVPLLTRQHSMIYAIGALLLSLGYLRYGMLFSFHQSISSARRLLAASIIYLPLLFILMMVF
jgi:protoheme IX farnesyltransferase